MSEMCFINKIALPCLVAEVVVEAEVVVVAEVVVEVAEVVAEVVGST